jgi:plastocyanin
VQAATTLNVGVGVGSGTVSGNAYTPGEVTVLVGDSVKYTIASDEPHSITFGNGPADAPPPFWPAAGFTGTVPPPPATAALTASYNGTGFLNTEIIFKGSSATVTFTAAGTFGFICQIHPGMAGKVNVVASGTTTTQAEADAKAKSTQDAILAQVSPLTQSTEAKVKQTKRSNGTSLWDIYATALTDPGPQPGGGTGFLELLQFIPPSFQIDAGDTVRWNSPAPHTVTFPAAGQDPTSIDPFTAKATTNAVYDGKSFYNSGLFAFGGAPTSYELTFPKAGSYGYICALHWPLGQTGTIVVAAAPSVTLPPTDIGPGVPAAPTGAPPWLPFALAALFGVSAVAGTLVLRRR